VILGKNDTGKNGTGNKDTNGKVGKKHTNVKFSPTPNSNSYFQT